LTKTLIVKRARFAGVEKREKREKLKAGSTGNMFTTEGMEDTEEYIFTMKDMKGHEDNT